MANYLSVGDMSQAFQMNRYNAALKSKANQLAQEQVTGQTQDIAARLNGDYSPLASLERSLNSLEAFRVANSDAALFISTMQNALGNMQDIAAEAATGLIAASNSGYDQTISPVVSDARQRFSAVISTLNTQIAGRSLFAGSATDRLPLASSETILSSLKTAVATETTAAGVQGVVDAWFAPGGGFDSVAYLGSATDIAPLSIGQNETANAAVRADSDAVRETLKGLALASLVHENVLSGNQGAQSELVGVAGSILLNAGSGVQDARTRIGTIEAQIEQASVRNQSELSALKISRSELLAADPYETATRLEATQLQLETLYTLTARLSRLTLTDYL